MKKPKQKIAPPIMAFPTSKDGLPNMSSAHTFCFLLLL